MKKQILCALSVAALAATMLTVPVYAAEGTPTIRVEAENYQSDQNWTINRSVGNCGVNINDMLKDRGFLYFNNGKYENVTDDNKPSATYKFNVDKAGIYDLEYAANYLKNDDTSNYCMYLSPFSVTLNNDKILFDGDTPKNTEIISYTAPENPNDYLGTYKLPVYLKEGENKITFTVEGNTPTSTQYTFYLDYFQYAYNETATKSDAIQVEAEELIAGNVPNTATNVEKMDSDGDAAAKEAAPFASNQTMYRFYYANDTKGGYLEYIVPSAKDGDFSLEITGSNARNTSTLNAWCGDFDVVINDGTRISVGEDVTPVHKASIYDIMTAKQTVKLKQGLNKIRVELDIPDTSKDKRYLIHLDYLKFTPVEKIEVKEKFEPFGGTYEKGTGTAEFTAEGLALDDMSKLVFKSEIVDVATYKYIDPKTITSGGGSVNLAVQLTNIPADVTNVELGVANFEVE